MIFFSSENMEILRKQNKKHLEKRAINEYLLSALDLRGLRVTIRRSAFDHAPPDRVYWRKVSINFIKNVSSSISH